MMSSNNYIFVIIFGSITFLNFINKRYILKMENLQQKTKEQKNIDTQTNTESKDIEQLNITNNKILEELKKIKEILLYQGLSERKKQQLKTGKNSKIISSLKRFY